MSPQPTASTEPECGNPDTWPWRCLDCGSTIYHDGEFCRACARSRPVGGGAEAAPTPDGFVDWMREQRPAPFVLKVTVVAGLELALTAVWIQLLVGGAIAGAGAVAFAP